MTKLSYGEKAVGIEFNPSGSGEVHKCKTQFAQTINQLHELHENSKSDFQKELITTAISHSITAQMWAVKALTYQGT